MSYRQLEMPGGSTRFEDAPRVDIVAGSGESLSLRLTYNASQSTGGLAPTLGELTFTGVLEYRWLAGGFEYELYAQHEEDYCFGLIEVLDSQYVEAMASRGMLRAYAGKRFGDVIPESSVRHFRIAFDDYGSFDVFALDVSVSLISEPRQ